MLVQRQETHSLTEEDADHVPQLPSMDDTKATSSARF